MKRDAKHGPAELNAKAVSAGPLSRIQIYLLIALCAAGIVLRLAGIGSHSLSHYDEGVYVSNGIQSAFGDPLRFNFDQPLHSPPIFPWLIAAVCWLLQTPWPAAGQLVSGIAGSATLPVVFLIARRLGGNIVGLMALALLAFSDLHIAYSRMALTDVALTFWFAVAIYFVLRLHSSLDRPSADAGAWLWTLLIAGATAAAWNTKYNGWMPPVIALIAAVAAVARRRFFALAASEERVSAAKLVSCLAVALAMGGLSFVPWYLFVERTFPGGYQAVTAHHQTYIGGLRDWPQNATRLLASMTGYRHAGWAILCLAAAGVGLFLLARRRSRRGNAESAPSLMVPAAVILLALVGIGSDATLIVVAICSIVPAVRFGRFPELIVAVWVGTFLILLPFYHPYTRLLLPACVASICLASCAIARVLSLADAQSETQVPAPAEDTLWKRSFLLASPTLLLIVAFVRPYGWFPSAELWNRWSADTSYRAVANAILAATEPDALVVCQAQPPLTLYVPRERLPIGNVSFAAVLDQIPRDRSCYLAVDFFWLHAQPDNEALVGIQSNRERLRAVGVVDNDLNLVTLGDFLSPAQVAEKVLHDRDPPARPGPIPSPLEAMQRDVIVIFAIDRD